MNIVRCDAFIEAAKTYINASRALKRFGIREAKGLLPNATLALKAAGFDRREIIEMAELLRDDLGAYPDQVFAKISGEDFDPRPWMRWGSAKQG